MACFHPLRAFQTAAGVFFSRQTVVGDYKEIELPCGQCRGCRLERSRQWAIRCVHEAQMHWDNCFITLTYSDEFLPQVVPGVGTLRYSDFQQFMRRLRKRVYSLPAEFKTGDRPGGSSGLSALGVRSNEQSVVRFYMCGEYGSRTLRPHFHACLFGIDFVDKKYFKLSDSGSKCYTSAVLSELWPYGDSLVGSLTFESAAYTARYCMDKVNGDAAAAHYSVANTETGEIFRREPEFNHMSLKPGIGAGWYEKFSTDVYPDGEVVVRGKLCRAPRYYDKRFAKDDPAEFAELATRRELVGYGKRADNTYERLAVRERVCEARLSFLKRSLGDDDAS